MVDVGRLVHLLAEAEVAVEVGVQERRVVLERVERLKDGWQFLVLDLDQVERVLRDVLVVGGHGRDALAKEAHPLVGQHRHVLHVAAPESAHACPRR